MVGLTPLGFSAFCSGFYMLLSQKLYHKQCTLYQAGTEEEFCDPSVRVIWSGLSSPSGVVSQVPWARSWMPTIKLRAKEALPSNDPEV